MGRPRAACRSHGDRRAPLACRRFKQRLRSRTCVFAVAAGPQSSRNVSPGVDLAQIRPSFARAGQFWGRFRPHFSRILPSSTVLARFWSMLTKHFDQYWSNLVNFRHCWPISPNVSQHRPCLVEHFQSLANFGPASAQIGQFWSSFARCWLANFAPKRPELGPCLLFVVRIWAMRNFPKGIMRLRYLSEPPESPEVRAHLLTCPRQTRTCFTESGRTLPNFGPMSTNFGQLWHSLGRI